MLGSTRAFVWAPLGGIAFLLAACTIGPRTPIEVPQSAIEKDDAAVAPSKDEYEDFTEEDARTGGNYQVTEIGHAMISIGDRPPWAKLERVVEDDAASAGASAIWRLQKSIFVGQGYLHQAAFSPDGESVVTLSTQSGQLYQYARSGKLMTTIELPGFKEFDEASFTPLAELRERPQVFVARPKGTSVLDLDSGKFDSLDDTPPGTDIAHSGRTGLYGISYRETSPQSGLLMLQWLTGEIALKAACSHRPDGWALSPDGRYIVISYYPAAVAEVIDLQNKELVSTIPLPQWGSSVDISPDGSLIALGGEKLQIATFPEGTLLAEDTKYGNNIDSVRFTPQGDLLLTSAYDGMARSYALPKDFATSKQLPRPQQLKHGGTANVYGLGLTRDGRSLVTSSGDKTLKIWTR